MKNSQMHEIDNSESDQLIPKSEKKIDLSKSNARFYMLFLSCLLCIGSYFAYDSPTALETQLKKVRKK